MRFPIKFTSSSALSFHETPVSMETGKKMCEFSKFLYLAHLFGCIWLLDRLRLLHVWLCSVCVNPRMCLAPSRLRLKVYHLARGSKLFHSVVCRIARVLQAL